MSVIANLPPYHPDQPEPQISGYTSLPPIEKTDNVIDSEVIPTKRFSQATAAPILPDIVLGCASFGPIYDVDPILPLRLVRLSLSSGTTAFDTSPAYHPSEIILGNCLRALQIDWPRESYKLVTKVGMYGPKAEEHIYEAVSVRRCVERSLKRLGTEYLDIVYLHDIECRSAFRCPSGNHLDALEPAHAGKYGLAESQLHLAGPGDEEILAGLGELRRLQTEGKIKHVGIAGYPLPILLRFCRLALKITGRPIDVVQTWGHQTLGCHTLADDFLRAFQDAGVGLVTNASPLCLGLYTRNGGSEWLKSVAEPLIEPVRAAVGLCDTEGLTIEDVAVEYAMRELKMRTGDQVPVIIGPSSPEELHAYLRSYARARKGSGDGREKVVADRVVRLMRDRGAENWSWTNT